MWSERLARAQVAYPGRFITSTAAATVVAAALIAGLHLDSSYEALLPADAPELLNAESVRARTGGTRQLVIAIRGPDEEARLAFGRELVPRLRNTARVRSADLELPVDFLRARGLWLMRSEALEELVHAVDLAAAATLLAAINPAATAVAWKRVGEIVRQERERLPLQPVMTSADGRYTFMLVVPTIKFSDMQAVRALIGAVEREIAALDPAARGIQVRLAGNVALIAEQHATMTRDLRNASVVALVLGVLIVALFTRRLLAPLLIAVPLVAGVAWTFGLTRILFGHVNIITGFLVAVLIGLGIDFGVHLFVRYQQEREQPDGAAEALIRTVRGTLPPALIAALTTAGTFFAFSVARFKGFSEFGLVAGSGVLFTLVSSFMLLPPLLLLFDARIKRAALPVPPPSLRRSPLSWPVALVAVLSLVAVASFGAAHLGDIPYHNDYRALRGASPATKFFDYVNENLGLKFNPAVVVVPSLDDAARARQLALQRTAAAADDGGPRIGRVISITDLLPRRGDAHRNLVAQLAATLSRPPLASLEPAPPLVEQARRMVQAKPWSFDDLPQLLRRRFSTLDGEGFLVFLWPDRRTDTDVTAAAWEEELGALSASLDRAGIAHALADESLIIAWIYRLIVADGPRMMALAAVVVLLFLLLDLRSLRRAVLVYIPLAVAMLSFGAVLYVWRLEINMFNLVVLPSIIGIGIDNAVHIYHRYRTEGPGSIGLVMRRTGTAVLLASLTTGAGFGSALVSHHAGLRSLGTLALIGIGLAFLASTIFFPCLLQLLERRTQGVAGSPPSLPDVDITN